MCYHASSATSSLVTGSIGTAKRNFDSSLAGKPQWLADVPVQYVVQLASPKA